MLLTLIILSSLFNTISNHTFNSYSTDPNTYILLKLSEINFVNYVERQLQRPLLQRKCRRELDCIECHWGYIEYYSEEHCNLRWVFGGFGPGKNRRWKVTYKQIRITKDGILEFDIEIPMKPNPQIKTIKFQLAKQELKSK